MDLPSNLGDSNPAKAGRLRALIGADVVKPAAARPLLHHLRQLHVHTVQLPGTRASPAALRAAWQRALLDRPARDALQRAGTLNWCRELRRQYPLKNTGKGNSLIHSVSLFLWGIQDTDFVLQKTFHEALVKAHDANFKLRLQTEYQRLQGFADQASLSQAEIWDQEWENVIECADPASAASRAVTNIYQDVHLFVLANIIRRPIIVIAGNSEEGLKSSSSKTSSPAGIYLPLHWPPLQCCTCPVLLSYEHRYFTPLISINDIGPEINAFPLVVPDRTGSVELPIRFLLEAEKVNRKQLLSNYLIEISVPDCHGVEFINAARLLINPLPDDLNLVLDYFQLVNHRYKSWQESSGNVTNNRNGKKVDFLSPLSIVEDKCLTHGCPYFCSKFTKPFCHMCHDAFQSNKESSESKTGKQGDCRQVGKHFNKERSTSFEPQDVSDHQSKSGISFFSETNALKCKLAECPFTGSETLHGFCASCFHKLGHLDLIPEKGRNSDLAVPGEILDERLDIFRERCSKCEQEGRKCNGLCDLRANALTLMRGTADQASSELQQAGLGIVDSGQGQDLQGGRVRESKQCKNPSCQFFGTEEQSGLCTTCFFKHVEGLGVFSQRDSDQGHSEHSPSPPQRKCSQISSHLREMTVCRSSDCSMLANPAYSGHCQKCYVKQLYSVPLAGHCPEEHHIWDPLLPRCSNGNAANSQRSSDQTTREPFVLEQEGSGNTSCLVQNSQTRILPASDQLNLKPQKHICRSEGCEHFGNTKCDGYCNACFTSSPTHSK